MSDILVRVVSYRDYELPRTIASAWEQADDPSRVRFAIVNQTGPETAHQLDPLRGDARVLIFQVPWQSARGLGWARRLTDRMRGEETYTLQVDSHMRFSAGWDSALIEQWQNLEDPHAVLSCYPAPYSIVDEQFVTLHPVPSHIIVPAGVDQYGLPRQDGGPAVAGGHHALLVSGGFQFAAGEVCSRVEQVRDVFIADEYVQALRLFTHGWNVYAPDSVPLYHLYQRDKAADVHGFVDDFHSTPETDQVYQKLLARSVAMAHALISGDGEALLGAKRTREEFAERLRSLG